MITVITLTKNERYLAPFFLRHYERFVDRIVVYDNQSSDGTAEYLAQHPKVRVEHYNTGGLLHDSVHAQLKSQAYRQLPGDWFIIVDFDEFVWHPDLQGYLKQCEKRGETLARTMGYNMFGDTLPEDDGVSLLSSVVRNGVPDARYSKPCVVHRDAHVIYKPGAHKLSTYSDGVVASSSVEIKLLHYKWLSWDYAIGKVSHAAQHLSEENRKNGWGVEVRHQADLKSYYQDLERYYRDSLANSVAVI